MQFATVLRRRRMLRDYRITPVPAELVDRVVNAGRRAPTAGFTQGITFLILDTPEDVAGFWAASGEEGAPESAWLTGMRSAPVLIMVWTSEQAYLDRYAESDKGWADRDPDRWSAPYWWVDAGMAAQSILLAAVDAGLGGSFFGVPPGRHDAVRTAYAVPAEQRPAGVISLGYPFGTAGVEGSASRRPRRAWDDQVRRGRW